MTLKNQMADQLHSEQQQGQGCLYVVATPIGNLADITRRAVEVLSEVDWIAAEDTRNTKQLLNALALNNNLISLHEHNEQQRAEQLLLKLQSGENGALVSDAGTPLINDPGYYLVNLLRAQGISVIPVPGVSAVITALSCAGLPTDRFTYEGFLPAKNSKKLERLEKLKTEERTMVFYESPHRLLDTLVAMQTVFGSERQAVIGRELTKKFEQFLSGCLAEVLQYFEDNTGKVRGEFVITLAGHLETETVANEALLDIDNMIKVMLMQGLPVKQLAAIVAELTGEKKKVIYNRALELKLE